LNEVTGIKYIPTGARAAIYRRAVKKLVKAKDTSCGWASKERSANTFKQFLAIMCPELHLLKSIRKF
jgi:hypothetical protein